MLHHSFNEKEMSVISAMRDYLLESGLQNCANAFDKAVSEVITYETNGVYNNHYSKNVNRYLCEALLINTQMRMEHLMMILLVFWKMYHLSRRKQDGGYSTDITSVQSVVRQHITTHTSIARIAVQR